MTETKDTFILHALGMEVDRQTFEALTNDPQRWAEYLSVCRKRGPQIPRRIVSHAAGHWHAILEGKEVSTSDAPFADVAEVHPAAKLVLALQSKGAGPSTEWALPSTEEARQITLPQMVSVYRLLSEVADLVVYINARAVGKDRRLKEGLMRQLAAQLVARVDEALIKEFYLKEGAVLHYEDHGADFEPDGKTVKSWRYRKNTKVDVRPGNRMLLTYDPEKLSPRRLADVMEVFERMPQPQTIFLARAGSGGYLIEADLDHVHDRLVAKDLTKEPFDREGFVAKQMERILEWNR